jgi:hypothetical protein
MLFGTSQEAFLAVSQSKDGAVSLTKGAVLAVEGKGHQSKGALLAVRGEEVT